MGIIFSLFAIVFPLLDRMISKLLVYKKDDQNSSKPDKGIKVVAVMFACLFIASTSLLNFSFSFLVSIIMIPIYHFVSPTSSRILNFFQFLFLAVASPFSLLYFVSPLLHSNFYQLLSLVFEQYRIFSNFIYPFIWLVYLPINILFIKMMQQ